MEIIFSARGTGACPVCKKRENCMIQIQIQKVMKEIPDLQAYGMEAVIYNCPAFVEEF